MTILIDTNVILDVVTDDPIWAEWSISNLEAIADNRLIINPVVYAELCFNYDSSTEVDQLIRQFRFSLSEIPREGLFSAARAFRSYRSNGGARDSVLPDFFIGGHADSAKCSLMTRDSKRFRTYFPNVTLLSP